MAGTVYGMAMSTCTQRIFVVAHELGVELKLSPVDLMKGEHKQPAHLARQPFGQVPAYESADGVKLFESRAIARYIDAKAGSKLSHHNNLAEFGRVETWASVEAFNFDKYASALTVELVFKGFRGEKPDQNEVTKLKGQLSNTLDVYEKELATRKYLAGDFLSLADLFHLPYGSHVFRQAPELLDSRPHVKKWFESLTSLPSWQKTLALAQH
eukprot:Phypoly_transcript_17450.p1 GENE.Phypoly_transcript_17450~~Phypoly_transcript_17450.p1  ORF type:complete len:212 (+),score=39.36 Phypoly_transcript_17450:126-761(+)